MNRIIGVLATYAVPILGAALVAVAIAWAVQTWRIGNLQEDKALLKTQLDAAVGANRTNQATIKALVTAAQENAAKYTQTLREQRSAVDRARELEIQLTERASDDIATIQDTDDACGLSPLPDDIRGRLRVSESRDRDGGGSDHRGAAGADRPGADPTASPARR